MAIGGFKFFIQKSRPKTFLRASKFCLKKRSHDFQIKLQRYFKKSSQNLLNMQTMAFKSSIHVMAPQRGLQKSMPWPYTRCFKKSFENPRHGVSNCFSKILHDFKKGASKPLKIHAFAYGKSRNLYLEPHKNSGLGFTNRVLKDLVSNTKYIRFGLKNEASCI